jgi:hypothetical protein
MRRAFLSLLVTMVVLGSSALARDLKTISGEVFKNVTVQSRDAIGIQILHDDGVVYLDFKNLDAADQKEFGYNPETYADAWKQKFEAEKQRRELAELAARQAIAVARTQALAAEQQANAAAQDNAQQGTQTGLQVSVDSPGFTYGGYPVGGFLVPGVTTVVTGRGRNVLPCLPGYGAAVGPLEIRRH